MEKYTKILCWLIAKSRDKVRLNCCPTTLILNLAIKSITKETHVILDGVTINPTILNESIFLRKLININSNSDQHIADRLVANASLPMPRSGKHYILKQCS